MTGGGQPIQPAEVRNNIDLKAERAKALYNADKKAPLRKSHDNPEVKELYADFLGEPNGHLAHELLHDPLRGQKQKAHRLNDLNRFLSNAEIFRRYFLFAFTFFVEIPSKTLKAFAFSKGFVVLLKGKINLPSGATDDILGIYQAGV